MPAASISEIWGEGHGGCSSQQQAWRPSSRSPAPGRPCRRSCSHVQAHGVPCVLGRARHSLSSAVPACEAVSGSVLRMHDSEHDNGRGPLGQRRSASQNRTHQRRHIIPDRRVGGCTGIAPVGRPPDRSGHRTPHLCWSRGTPRLGTGSLRRSQGGAQPSVTVQLRKRFGGWRTGPRRCAARRRRSSPRGRRSGRRSTPATGGGTVMTRGRRRAERWSMPRCGGARPPEPWPHDLQRHHTPLRRSVPDRMHARAPLSEPVSELGSYRRQRARRPGDLGRLLVRPTLSVGVDHVAMDAGGRAGPAGDGPVPRDEPGRAERRTRPARPTTTESGR